MNPVDLISHVGEQQRPATEENAEGDWQGLINRSWAEDWSDPREDIYTLDDGTPSHVFGFFV